VNTETLNQAIEENLNTLEVISQSEFAAHIKADILGWIQKLKTMHANLEVWVGAQRYWINLDIIFNSALFADIFGDTTKQFISTRLQYQRIMWSSYRNPKAIYNLMIESRIRVFREMTVHFQVLQKKVHDFLEEKRLVFSRFFFLNDSQFLEFLTLANTSQDFSTYISTLFVGAQNLYI
jgi:dynein heavy chain, axonemal